MNRVFFISFLFACCLLREFNVQNVPWEPPALRGLRWVPALLIRKRSFIRGGEAGVSKQPQLHHSHLPRSKVPVGPCHTRNLFENPCSWNSQTDVFSAGVMALTKSYSCAFL